MTAELSAKKLAEAARMLSAAVKSGDKAEIKYARWGYDLWYYRYTNPFGVKKTFS